MPYSSDAQRKFFHTDTAKKKGITDKEVNEFDQASKGMKLPEHAKKMADGGEVKDPAVESQTEFQKGFKGEVNDTTDKIQKAVRSSDYGSLAGLRALMEQHYGKPQESTSTPKGYAPGGDVSPYPTQSNGMDGLPGFDVANSNATIPMNGTPPGAPAIMPQVPVTQNTETAPLTNAPMPIPPQGTPSAPPLGQLASQLNSTPPTNYDFYKNLSAQDRMALAQKLLAQQNSGGMLAAKGAAGLGDAISNSFGKGGSNALGNIQQMNKDQTAAQLESVDTGRTQKMQDLQASVAMQENDPQSPYSSGMRQFVTSVTGKQVPSGVSAAMLRSAFGDIAKIFDSQMVAATAAAGQGVEAGKELAGQGFFQRILNSMSPNAGNAALTKAAGGNAAPTGGTKLTTPGGVSYSVH